MSEAEFVPDWTLAPGDVLGAVLTVHGWSADDLCARSGLAPSYVAALLAAGDVRLGAYAAARLAAATAVDARAWRALEDGYRADLARGAARRQPTGVDLYE